MSNSQHTKEELEKHSNMLGRIGLLVEDWCTDEECTTYDAVKNLLRHYHGLKVQYHRLALREAKQDLDAFNES